MHTDTTAIIRPPKENKGMTALPRQRARTATPATADAKGTVRPAPTGYAQRHAHHQYNHSAAYAAQEETP